MLLLPHALLFFLRTAFFVAAQGFESGGSTTAHRGYTFTGGSAGYGLTDPCMTVSPPCVTEADRYSLEALWSIHQMMDDDQDGGIEVEESVEFIIEDMKQQQTNKHSNLHQEDQHITIEELWRGWKSSTVHNWTQDEVLRWLREFVELPQYERNFKDFKVNGNTLPRIAANEPSFLSGHLRVQDQRDKQKLNIKALDVVLFGPPTRPHNYVKDMLLIVSVVMGIGGCWFAQAQNKASKIHVAKMMKDLESLQRAEQSLRDLQEQLERAQEEKRNVAEEKQNLEEKMRDEIMGAQEEAHRLHRLRQGAVTELSRLRYAEEELEQIRGALKQAEMDIQASWSASEALQLWLQLTHEVEVQYYNVKKQRAELQLNTAKEEAEKIKKKRSSVLGTLHMAHSSSLDQVDHKILEAKNSLFEVTACLRERLHRWQQIEFLCGFPIFRNPGLGKLTAQLYSDLSAPVPHRGPQAPCSCQSSAHGSMEDLFEDPVPPVVSAIPISSIKHSPLTRGSTTCRSRRLGVITQSSSSTISSDPDLIMPARASQPCFEEQEGNFLNHKKRHESLEVFPDGEYMTSTPFGRMIAKSATIDCSAQKVNQGEVEVLADSSVGKSSNKELEASIDSSNTTEEIEVCANVTTRMMKNNIVMDIHRGLETPPDLVDKVDIAESLMDTISLDGQARKGFSDEYEDSAAMKMDGDTTEVLVDTASGNISSDVSDFPLDATTRKKFWNEDIPVNVRTRKISRDMMGGSMDSGSEKIIQGEIELHFDTITRKFTRDMMGMSMDTCFTKLSWDKGEFQLDSSVRGMPIEKMSAFAGTKARKVSREESKYTGDTASRKNVQRESLLDIPSHKVSREKQEFCLESSASRKILRDDQETPTTSIRRRLPRDIDSAIDTSTGNDSWDRADIPMESAKQRMQSDSSSCRIGQPDLTVTSLLPQKPASECFPHGQLSLLVYDGILEKSCKPFEPTPKNSGDSSASVPNLPHNILQRDTEQHLPPASTPLSTQTRDGGEGRSKDKEKSKKSSILKNLFKKKKEPASEKPQSGLQKL